MRVRGPRWVKNLRMTVPRLVGAGVLCGSCLVVSLSTGSTIASAVPNYGQGYVMIGQDGGAFAFGNAGFYGSIPYTFHTTAQSWLFYPINAGATSPANDGYWMMTSYGEECAFGNVEAAEPGGAYDMGTNMCFDPPTGLTYVGTPVAMAGYDDAGYWQTTTTGDIYAFGNAPYDGGLSTPPAGSSIVAMAATADHQGYWLVAANGAVYAFGDAQYIGGMNGQTLNKPIVAIVDDPAASTSGHTGNDGYVLIGGDGGQFAYNAPSEGLIADTALPFPISSAAESSDGAGNMMVGQDGGALTFGDFQFQGAMSGNGLAFPSNGIVAMGNM